MIKSNSKSLVSKLSSPKGYSRIFFNATSVLAVLLLTLFSLSSCAKKDSGNLLSQIKNKGEITVATEGTWAPWTFHNEEDKLTGFDVEVAKLIAKKLNVKPNIVEVEWDGIFAGIDSKRYDIAANGVEITLERSQKYNFSIPYGYVKTAVIVRKDNDSIKSFNDLKGKTTANTLASTYALMAEEYGAKALGVDDLNQTLELVLAGRVDATLNSDVSFYDYIKSHPDANLKIACVTEGASEISIPLRSTSDCDSLLTEINKAIQELSDEGELSRISIQFFGQDITHK